MKRCSREKWLVKHEQDKAVALTASSTALSANVRKGADVLADVLATRKSKTKLHLSKYELEASQEAAEHPEKLKIARQAKEIAQMAGEVWPEEREEVIQTLVNVAIPRPVAQGAAKALQSVAISRCNQNDSRVICGGWHALCS